MDDGYQGPCRVTNIIRDRDSQALHRSGLCRKAGGIVGIFLLQDHHPACIFLRLACWGDVWHGLFIVAMLIMMKRRRRRMMKMKMSLPPPYLQGSSYMASRRTRETVLSPPPHSIPSIPIGVPTYHTAQDITPTNPAICLPTSAVFFPNPPSQPACSSGARSVPISTSIIDRGHSHRQPGFLLFTGIHTVHTDSTTTTTC